MSFMEEINPSECACKVNFIYVKFLWNEFIPPIVIPMAAGVSCTLFQKELSNIQMLQVKADIEHALIAQQNRLYIIILRLNLVIQ